MKDDRLPRQTLIWVLSMAKWKLGQLQKKGNFRQA